LRRRRSHQGFAQEIIETTDENAGATHPGAIPTNATLILLPSHLVDQWHSEIGKFLLELKGNVIVTGSGKASHFAKLTIREVLEAKIIIVAWDNCTKPSYLKMVANLAGLVEPVVNWWKLSTSGNCGQLVLTSVHFHYAHSPAKSNAEISSLTPAKSKADLFNCFDDLQLEGTWHQLRFVVFGRWVLHLRIFVGV
jgi:hypothetical protein